MSYDPFFKTDDMSLNTRFSFAVSVCNRRTISSKACIIKIKTKQIKITAFGYSHVRFRKILAETIATLP